VVAEPLPDLTDAVDGDDDPVAEAG
jgi:hypothetical protein